MEREASARQRTTLEWTVIVCTLAGFSLTCGFVPPVRHTTVALVWGCRRYTLVAAWFTFAGATSAIVSLGAASNARVRRRVVLASCILDSFIGVATFGLRIRPASLIVGVVVAVSFALTGTALATATRASTEHIATREAAWRTIEQPAERVRTAFRRFNLGDITSGRVLRVVGGAIMVVVTLGLSGGIALAIQGIGAVTGTAHVSAASDRHPETKSASTSAAKAAASSSGAAGHSTTPPIVLGCVGDFGDGVITISHELRDLVRTVGERAADQYGACPLGKLRAAYARIYEQPAFTADSDHARVVAWFDRAGKPHATFVTSDQANGYLRLDSTLDWAQLGLPLDAIECHGPAVQPFVDLDNKVIAVGVEQRVDNIGTAEEAIYIPGQLVPAWLERSTSTGIVGVPAGPSQVRGSALRQWFTNWSAPLYASNDLSRAPALARLEALCR